MRKKLLIITALLAVGLTAVLLWPTAGYDINRVHSELVPMKRA